MGSNGFWTLAFFKIYIFFCDLQKKEMHAGSIGKANQHEFSKLMEKPAREDYTRFTLASDKTGLAKTHGSRCASYLTLIYNPNQGKTVLTSER